MEIKNLFLFKIYFYLKFILKKVQTLELKALAYDNFNSTPTLNSTCTIEITIEDQNDNRPKLEYPKDADLPLVFSLDQTSSNQNASKLIQMANNSSNNNNKLTRFIASDADSPQNSHISYNLQRQIRVKKEPQKPLELVNLFELEPKSGVLSLRQKKSEAPAGFYALVIDLSDQQPDMEVVQKTRVYAFVVLTNSDTGVLMAHEIFRLKQVLNSTRLNDEAELNRNGNEDYYDYEGEDEVKSQDYRFERILNQLKQVIFIYFYQVKYYQYYYLNLFLIHQSCIKKISS